MRRKWRRRHDEGGGGSRMSCADMRQPPVRGNEDRGLVAVAEPEHAQNPDVDPVLEELVAEVFGNGAVLALLAQRVILAGRRYEPALGGDRGDSAQDSLGVVFQRHQDELAVHGRGLEIVLVRQDQVGVELEPAFGEPEKGAYHLRIIEESHWYLPAAGSDGDSRCASKTCRRSARICSRTASSSALCRITKSRSTTCA